MVTVYICNKEFPRLGLEEGDYFPAERFSKKAVEEYLAKGSIYKEEEEELADRTN